MIELDCQLIKNNYNRNAIAVSGNAAIACGLLASSVKVVTSYPGTPCAEITEHLKYFLDDFKFYLEWSVNEKVGFEIAAAASMTGVRSAFITKHVGMNVVADSLMHVCYAGIKAGMVIISADDPGAFNSPIEQDTRSYARLSEIAGMEPSNQQEAKDMVSEAFNISEKIKLPVLIRVTNRVLYGRGKIINSDFCSNDTGINAEFIKGDMRWFIAGRNAVKQHKWLHKQQEQLADIVNASPSNVVEWSQKKKYGVITSGVSYYYVKEALKNTSIENQVSILKIGCFHPIPEEVTKQFLSKIEELLVVEELEPFIEEQVLRVMAETGKKMQIYGKHSCHFQHTDAFSAEMVRDVIDRIWLSKESVPSIKKEKSGSLTEIVSNEHLTFCAGCPHRASFYVLKKALKALKQEFVITGDIGCYILGARHPFLSIDSVFCMGASIGIGNGLYQAKISQRIIAVIGDSTFLHAGIPALVNSCYNNVDILVYILDNQAVAMTGLQPHPGVGVNLRGEKSKLVKIEEIANACNVNYCAVINPFKVNKTKKILQKALGMKGQRVIIARHECIQAARNRNETAAGRMQKYEIDQKKCKRCMICMNLLHCPAISVKAERYLISQFLCSGCGLCYQVCPHGAISLKR